MGKTQHENKGDTIERGSYVYKPLGDNHYNCALYKAS